MKEGRLWRQAIAWAESMISGVTRARTFGLAAEMSFWLFLSLVPLAAVVGWLAARVATSSRLASPLLETVPLEVRELLARQVHRVAAWHGATVAPVAAVTFLWLAGSGVHAVFDALEVQSGTSRPWWKKRALSLATCLVLALGAAAMGLLGVGAGWMGRLAGRALPPVLNALENGPLWSALRWLLAALIAVSMTAGLYRIGIPRKRGEHAPILPGALVSVALQALLGFAYGVYVTKLGGSGAYQAGLAVVGMTLTTLWLFSIALLLGVNLNGALGERRHPT
jgi:membrane protein